MAVTGRGVLRWLAGSSILTKSRPQFELQLRDIEEDCEEWLTSEAAIRSGAATKKASNVVKMRRAAG